MRYNYSYYPILASSGRMREEAMTLLADAGIFARRYFYPSLNTLPYVLSSTMPVAEDIAARVLCLPLYAGLAEDEVASVVRAIRTLSRGQ